MRALSGNPHRFRAPHSARSAQFNLFPLPSIPRADRPKSGRFRSSFGTSRAGPHCQRTPFEGTKKPIGWFRSILIQQAPRSTSCLSAALRRGGPRSYPPTPPCVNPFSHLFSSFFHHRSSRAAVTRSGSDFHTRTARVTRPDGFYDDRSRWNKLTVSARERVIPSL